MKKKLFGTLLFSVILSSLAYAEADDVMTMKDKIEAEEEARIREKYNGNPVISEVDNGDSVEKTTAITSGTTTTGMSSEEEREAYAALERARARIEKEEQEKLKAQQEIAEAQSQNQIEAQTEIKQEEKNNENPDQNQVIFVEPAAPRMTPEEEKEAYEALERVRARILKEEEERAELLKATTEQQIQQTN